MLKTLYGIEQKYSFIIKMKSKFAQKRKYKIQAGPESWNPAAGNQTATYWKSQINFLKRLEYCMHEY